MKRTNKKFTRAAFTLMEVNLAIFIMAIGVLAMVSLYPLGYRESQQSREDVRSAAVADYLLNQVTGALSSRNITWNEWESAIKSAVGKTPNGWRDYCNDAGVPKRGASSTANSIFTALMSASPAGGGRVPNGDIVYALVATWGKRVDANGAMQDDYSRVALSCRVAPRVSQLFAQPIYYTEIHFQGDQKDSTTGGGN